MPNSENNTSDNKEEKSLVKQVKELGEVVSTLRDVCKYSNNQTISIQTLDNSFGFSHFCLAQNSLLYSNFKREGFTTLKQTIVEEGLFSKDTIESAFECANYCDALAKKAMSIRFDEGAQNSHNVSVLIVKQGSRESCYDIRAYSCKLSFRLADIMEKHTHNSSGGWFIFSWQESKDVVVRRPATLNPTILQQLEVFVYSCLFNGEKLSAIQQWDETK